MYIKRGDRGGVFFNKNDQARRVAAPPGLDPVPIIPIPLHFHESVDHKNHQHNHECCLVRPFTKHSIDPFSDRFGDYENYHRTPDHWPEPMPAFLVFWHSNPQFHFDSERTLTHLYTVRVVAEISGRSRISLGRVRSQPRRNQPTAPRTGCNNPTQPAHKSDPTASVCRAPTNHPPQLRLRGIIISILILVSKQ